jgi:hypothetical protein
VAWCGGGSRLTISFSPESATDFNSVLSVADLGFLSRILIFFIPDPGSASKNLYFNSKNLYFNSKNGF